MSYDDPYDRPPRQVRHALTAAGLLLLAALLTTVIVSCT